MRILSCGFLLSLSQSLAVAADKTAADYYVHSLPGAPDGPLLKMHAGHVEINPEHHGNLFFWHFQNRHIANSQRTVIWLNGGPGCSSMDGALMEVGPYRLKNNTQLQYNEGSWDEFANILFLDQPVGTGFSYVDTDSYIHELKTMGDQVVIFLEKWFALFPEYEHDDVNCPFSGDSATVKVQRLIMAQLYFAGESYAGQYIPYIAQAIVDRNRDDSKQRWSLEGLLIGNGWISPTEQYLSYLPYMYKAGLIEGGSDVAKKVESQQSVCIKALDAAGNPPPVDVPQCEAVLQEILSLTKSNDGKGARCVNMYDVRLTDSYPSCGMNWPPDLDNVTPYLRRPDVIQALHVNPDKRSGWTECSGAVSSEFTQKHSLPSITLLPGLLEHMPVVLFSGEKDLICNHLGTEELIGNMEWNGGKGFELSPGTWAPRRDWTFEGEPAGIYQEARNLTYVLFYNSSHMVPFDYPRRTRDMLDRFLGVDIASIGGTPADSRIDGEKGLETSVGGHPNSTAAEEAEEERLQQAKWHAYYKSGEVALVIVVIMFGVWAWFIWSDRRKRAGYRGLFSGRRGGQSAAGGMEQARRAMGLESFRTKRSGRDLEAGDFDESELDDLHVETPREEDMERERYSLGLASSDDEADSGERRKAGREDNKGRGD
ncbi:MAG: Cell death protease [Sarea resinae]|nr:MAG: Cell death protease [Sarea resinae]